MSSRFVIRPATLSDRQGVSTLRERGRQDLDTDSVLRPSRGTDPDLEWVDQLAEHIADRCLLVATQKGRLAGHATLDLDDSCLGELYVRPRWRNLGAGRRLVEAIERLAVQFGLQILRVRVAPTALAFFHAMGYRDSLGSRPSGNAGSDRRWLERDLGRRQTRFGRQIAELGRELGIPPDYGRSHRLMLQPESTELANIGLDFAQREQYLHPAAAMAWYALRNAADDVGIDLQVISAFRSVDYQAGIFRRKIENGHCIDSILRVSAAPGFSEHHTGKALDLNCPGHPPLEASFERTLTFEWLTEHAFRHGFRLSYPRDNRHGIAFEPWHWAWTE